MSIFQRLAAVVMAALACALAACGTTGGVAQAPSESLAPGVYSEATGGVATAQASATPTPSASTTSSSGPTATPSPGPTASGGCTSCGTVVQGQSAAATVDATDQDKFSPQTVDITLGQIVKWQNTGSQPHTVTFSGDAAISDSDLTGGQSFEVKFTQAGTFPYFCQFHLALGMTGTVVVAAS